MSVKRNWSWIFYSLFSFLHSAFFHIDYFVTSPRHFWTLGFFFHANTIIKKLECLGSWHSMSNEWQFHFYTSLPLRLSRHRFFVHVLCTKAKSFSFYFLHPKKFNISILQKSKVEYCWMLMDYGNRIAIFASVVQKCFCLPDREENYNFCFVMHLIM